jgi:TonB-dependent starch-binding outer membrane protein SusC
MKKIIYFLVCLFPLGIVGQSITLTGSVIDLKDGSPIPGASIIEKGTNRGVLSDFEGTFEFNTSKGAILSISFLGMQTQEIKVENANLVVQLQSEINELDEVTISVGYFDISKKDLSGAITQVKSEQLEKNRTNTVEGLLQGQIAGVVLSESSEPGGGIGISIRGTNSMLGGTQPLYVVDGIPMSTLSDAKGNGNSGQAQSTLGFLNPNDIDKIEVLKDAAATAVYGARGANGVVLITTKSADKANGTDKINYCLLKLFLVMCSFCSHCL